MTGTIRRTVIDRRIIVRIDNISIDRRVYIDTQCMEWEVQVRVFGCSSSRTMTHGWLLPRSGTQLSRAQQAPRCCYPRRHCCYLRPSYDDGKYVSPNLKRKCHSVQTCVQRRMESIFHGRVYQNRPEKYPRHRTIMIKIYERLVMKTTSVLEFCATQR
jgi:hypothetical protein